MKISYSVRTDNAQVYICLPLNDGSYLFLAAKQLDGNTVTVFRKFEVDRDNSVMTHPTLHPVLTEVELDDELASLYQFALQDFTQDVLPPYTEEKMLREEIEARKREKLAGRKSLPAKEAMEIKKPYSYRLMELYERIDSNFHNMDEFVRRFFEAVVGKDELYQIYRQEADKAVVSE